MKRIIQYSIIGMTILLLSSCAKIYATKDAKTLAKKHEVIALAPPKVSITARKKISAEAMREQQKTESLNFQAEMYAWMLKRKMQDRVSQEIQDIETTNALLEEAGYFEKTISPTKLCKILEVDGIIVSKFALNKPMSDGAAVAVGLLFGAAGRTNEVKVALSIYDGATKKLIWNYDHKYSGGLGSSPTKLVDGLMRHASKKMPYTN